MSSGPGRSVFLEAVDHPGRELAPFTMSIASESVGPGTARDADEPAGHGDGRLP